MDGQRTRDLTVADVKIEVAERCRVAESYRGAEQNQATNGERLPEKHEEAFYNGAYEEHLRALTVVGGFRHSDRRNARRREVVLRLQDEHPEGRARRPRYLPRQGSAGRERRQLLRLHAPVQRAGEAEPGDEGQGRRRARFSKQRFRTAGAGNGRRDRAVLQADLRRHVSDVREGRDDEWTRAV